MVIRCLIGLCALSLGAAEWKTATPESQGISGPQLDAIRDSLAAKNTKTFLVVRHDRIVCEWYAADFNAKKPHGTASLAKALVGATSFLVALTDRRMQPDDKASKFIPQWRDHPQKSLITLRQLSTHTSGLEDAEADGVSHGKLTGWKGDFWKSLDPPNDPFTIARDLTPVVFPPGKQFPPGSDDGYSNPGFAMFGYAMTAALTGAPQSDLRTLLRDRILRPIGVPDDEWTVGYNKTVNVDGLPLVATWGGANYTARATAGVGRLLLHKGKWEGKQVIDAKWVREATTGAGLGFWVRGLSGTFSKALPPDAFAGAGAGMEFLLVVPSLDLIVVRNGKDISPKWSDLDAVLITPLIAAIKD